MCNHWLLKHTKYTSATFSRTLLLTHTFGTFSSSFLTCEGIHERGQGPVKHLKKRVSAGITCRSTQYRVLQDVWDARTVHGSRPELDTEQHTKLRFVRNTGTNMTENSVTDSHVYLKRLLESSLAA